MKNTVEIYYPIKKSREEILSKSIHQHFIKQENIHLLTPNCDKNLFLFGDNFIGLSLLLQNGFHEKIDLIYIDPPYNTKQDFTIESNKQVRTISRSNDKQAILAYSDKFELDEYLEFLRERLILMYELLSPIGSLYLHIDSKVGHYVKIILDEIFGINNYKNDIARVKSNPKNFKRRAYGNEKDMILFYAKNANMNIFNDVTIHFSDEEKLKKFNKIDENGRRYNTVPIHAPNETLNGETGKEWRGMLPPKGRHWRYIPSKLDELDELGLLEWSNKGKQNKLPLPRIKKFADEHGGKKIQDVWLNWKDPAYPSYPTEKNLDMLKMIIQQSSNPNSIVLDAFAGSGSTLLASNYLGRKFIGIDSSKVSLDIVQQNLEFELFNI